MKKYSFCLLLLNILMPSVGFSATYYSQIKQLQAEGLEDPYNTVHLMVDVTDSPCAKSNESDRFAIVNNVQQSAALAAVFTGKKIQLMPTGKCNSANIEEVNFIMIKAE